MNQPQEKPRLGVVREEKPEKRLRILVVNDDDVVSSVLRSGFYPLRTLSLKIVPDAETAIRMLSAGALRPRGGGSSDYFRRLRAAQARQGPLPLDRDAACHP